MLTKYPAGSDAWIVTGLLSAFGGILNVSGPIAITPPARPIVRLTVPLGSDEQESTRPNRSPISDAWGAPIGAGAGAVAVRSAQPPTTAATATSSAEQRR